MKTSRKIWVTDPKQESPHEHQQNLLLSRIITNVVRLAHPTPRSRYCLLTMRRRSSTKQSS